VFDKSSKLLCNVLRNTFLFVFFSFSLFFSIVSFTRSCRDACFVICKLLVRHYCELLFLASLSISTCEHSFICIINFPPPQIQDCFRFHSGGGRTRSAATLDNFPKSFAPLEIWDNPHVTAGWHLHTLQHSDLAFAPVSLPDSYFPPPYFHRSELHRVRHLASP